MTDQAQPAALPQGFAALAPFADNWGRLATQDERYLLRQKLPMAELRAYYDTIVPLLPAIFEHLDSFPFGEPLPAPEALLYRIALGISEVGQAVEVYGAPRVKLTPAGHSVPIGAARN